MIRIAPSRETDYRAVEARIAQLRTPAALKNFHAELSERYLDLNEKYFFSESFDGDFLFRQIEECWPLRNEPLFAMPFGVKDVFNTRVLPTAMGSEVWKDFKAGNNARVVDEIVAKGGIVFSKTTTAEFAVHYIQAGKTLNPHDAGRITGTSSSGSAVAVACGALPICLGTQTGGSIVRPASFCGVYGFKPSFGAYDRTGTLKTTDTLDTIGLLGSDIYGLRKLFGASFQQDPQYPFARKYFEHLAEYRRQDSFRIGVVTEQFAGYAGYAEEVKDDFGKFLETLISPELAVTPIQDISFINEIHALHQRIYCKSLSYYFQQEAKSGTGISEIMAEMIEMGSRITAAEYIDALEQQPDYRSRFDAAFADCDFLVTPSTASVAPPVGEEERLDTCLIWTFLGYPVLSVPAFWSDSTGLPFGLQIVGPRYSDLALLDFAERLVGKLRPLSA